jgi:hypothetical protein
VSTPDEHFGFQGTQDFIVIIATVSYLVLSILVLQLYGRVIVRGLLLEGQNTPLSPYIKYTFVNKTSLDITRNLRAFLHVCQLQMIMEGTGNPAFLYQQ